MQTNNTSRYRLKNIAEDNLNYYLLLLLGFMILGAIGLAHHEMWRDESEAWLIAKDSSSISALLENLKYTGHPPLWYFCLHIISKFVQHPWVMQLFHLLISVTFVYIFILYSPFTKLQKTLFCFGYYALYEYTLISRNYGLGIVFIFAFCALFPSRYQNYLPLAIILSLLCQANAYGLIISFLLLLTLILDALVNSDNNKNLYSKRWSITASLIIYGVSLTTAVLQILPPNDAVYKGDLLSVSEENFGDIQPEDLNSTGFHLRRFSRAIASIWSGYVPIPNFSEFHFHDTNIIYLFTEHKQTSEAGVDVVNYGDIFMFLFSLIILGIGAIAFYRQPIILFFYTIANSTIIGFLYLIRLSGVRQNGYLFFVGLICFWLSTNYPKSNWLSKLDNKFFDWIIKYKSLLLTILLCVHIVGGVYAYGRDILDPFSASEAATEYIRNNQYDKLTIIGKKEDIVSPLSAFLNKKIYYPESEHFGSFSVWTARKEQNPNITHQEILEQTNNLLNKEDKEVLLILDEELKSNIPEVTARELKKFESSIVIDEIYYLYLITKNNRLTTLSSTILINNELIKK